MSEKAAKATRRDIRRAVGVSGLHTVNAVARMVTQDVAPLAMQTQAQVTALRQDVDTLRGSVDAVATAQQAFTGRTFAGRLRWLVTGR